MSHNSVPPHYGETLDIHRYIYIWSPESSKMWFTDSKNMDTYVGKLGSKIFFSVAICMILVIGVSGDEDFEKLVENVADHPSCSSSDYGYSKFECMFLLGSICILTFWFDSFIGVGIGLTRWASLEMNHGQWCRRKGTNSWWMISLFMWMGSTLTGWWYLPWINPQEERSVRYFNKRPLWDWLCAGLGLSMMASGELFRSLPLSTMKKCSRYSLINNLNSNAFGFYGTLCPWPWTLFDVEFIETITLRKDDFQVVYVKYYISSHPNH